MPRNCPDCKIEMSLETHYGVNIDVCKVCAGIWFDDGELRELMEEDPNAPIKLEEEYVPELHLVEATSERKCPQCGIPLQPYNYMYNSPVLLDACPECGGFWVQDGELAKMQEYLNKTRATPAPAEQNQLEVATLDAMIAKQDVEKRGISDMRDFFSVLRARPFPWWNNQ